MKLGLTGQACINVDFKCWDDVHELPVNCLKELSDILLTHIELNCKTELKIFDVGIGTGIISLNILNHIIKKLKNIKKIESIIFEGVEIDSSIFETFNKNFENIIGPETIENGNVSNVKTIFKKYYNKNYNKNIIIKWHKENILKFDFKNEKYDLLFLIDFLHYIKKAEIKNLIDKLKSHFSLIVLGIPGGFIKNITFFKQNKNFEQLLENYNFSKIQNFFENYSNPCDYDNIINYFKESFYSVGSVYSIYRCSKTWQIVKDIYQNKAASLFRIHKEETINLILKENNIKENNIINYSLWTRIFLILKEKKQKNGK